MFHRVMIIVAVILALIFLSSREVQAAVVINEVFPNPSGDSSESTEFIELYNTDADLSVDLAGYRLEEAKGYTISGVLEPHNFISFSRSETGLALNNSGDTILLKDPSGEVLDTFTFEKTDDDLSWSRYPDGVGSFSLTTLATKDAPNFPPPTPTYTPTPTQAPTATPTNTPTNSPTATPTRQSTGSPISIDTPSPIIESDANLTESTHPDQVLSETIVNDSIGNDEDVSKRFPIPAILFITAGIIFIGAAVYLKFK